MGDVEEVAQILGSDRLIPEGPPFTIAKEAMLGDGDESGDDVRDDT